MTRRRRDLLVRAGTFAAGAAVAYLAERSMLRKRLLAPAVEGPPLGSIAGEVTEVRGPDGVRINVEVHGPAGAPQVVLVHAYGMSCRLWHEQVVALRDRLRLVTYDQPGHGRSSAPRSGAYSLDLLADALRTVIEQATDGRPVLLVGHSLGGITIMRLLQRHPDLSARIAGLVLLSTTAKAAPEALTLGVGVQVLARLERVMDSVAGSVARRAAYLSRVYRASTDLSFVATRNLALSSDADPRYVDFTEQLFLDTDLAVVAKLLPALVRLDERAAMECVRVPTLIVVGDRDRLTPLRNAKAMADACPYAELVVVPGAGHMSPLEARHVVNALLLRLVRDTGLVARAA